jgi:pSer/pThr/pTyr-binding forkhead associated (FHA) protein
MFRSDGERRSFSVTRNITVIGRREDCDLRIPHGDVSRKHCRVIRDGDVMRLEDLGSSNGTYHNGVRVGKDTDLHAGDSIQVGPVVFVLQIDGVPADEELHPITVESAATADGGQMPALAGPPPVPVPPPVPGSAAADGESEGEGTASMEELQALETLEPLPVDGGEELEALPVDEEPHAAQPPPLNARAHNANGGHGQEEGGFEIMEEPEHHDDAVPMDHIDLDAEQPHGRA